MAENRYKSSGRTVLRVLLVVILGMVMSYTYTGEKLPLNDGAGWDGVIYRDIVLNIDKTYFHHGINKYHMHRVLPFAVTHGLMRMAGVEMNNSNALWASVLMNVLMVVLSVVFLFRLSSFLRWKAHTETIAFSLIFFNVGVLKVFGYEPLVTDSLALLLSLMAAYYFFAHRTIPLVLTGIVALFSWPVLSVVVLILVAFPRTEVEYLGDTQQRQFFTQPLLTKVFRLIMILWVPVAFLLFVVYKHHVHPETSFLELFILRPAHSVALVVASMVSVCVFYYYATAAVAVEWGGVLRSIFARRSLLRIALCSICFIILYYASQYFGSQAIFSAFQQLTQMVHPPVTDIFIFLETPFAYQGMFILLILFFGRSIAREVCSYGVGYLLVLVMGMVFLMDIETRKLVMLYPFMLVPLMAAVNRKNLRAWVPLACVMVQLLLSACWFTMNTPELPAALAADDVSVFIDYPAQRYFYMHGPWQGRTTYLLIGGLEIILAIACVVLYRSNRFYVKDDKQQ